MEFTLILIRHFDEFNLGVYFKEVELQVLVESNVKKNIDNKWSDMDPSSYR